MVDGGSEAGLIPSYAGEQVPEAMKDPAYAGLLRAELRPGERVTMASFGTWQSDWGNNPHASGTRGLMAITDRRVIFLRPRRRTLSGKFKDRAAVSLDLSEVFTSGKFLANDAWTTFGHNRNGWYDSYLLKIDGPMAELHCSMWTNGLWDCAIAAGGHENRPPGT